MYKDQHRISSIPGLRYCPTIFTIQRPKSKNAAQSRSWPRPSSSTPILYVSESSPHIAKTEAIQVSCQCECTFGLIVSRDYRCFHPSRGLRQEMTAQGWLGLVESKKHTFSTTCPVVRFTQTRSSGTPKACTRSVLRVSAAPVILRTTVKRWVRPPPFVS